MNTYELLGLYPHNIRTCEKVREAFDNGQDTVSIIKATGTGKSYIGLNLALEHKDEKIIWLVPTNSIKEHIEQIVNSNPNLSMERDFPNLEIRTYSSLVNLSDEEIEALECDLLIVDELHHIGAPVWGEKVNTLIYTHENIKTFGMSAYSVRDRGTSYERDMTNPETEEIFSDTVVDRYDLYDAIIDGVLPLPVARAVLTENSSIIEKLQDALKVRKLTKKEAQKEIEERLDYIIKTIHKQNPIKEIIQETITENGKYIYFCPVLSYEGINDIETIKEQTIRYIKEKYPDKRIVVYQTTSDMGKEGNKNRDCFYHDVDLDGKDASDTIRIMFAKNQYNEGVHAPNIDGVFLGRKTESDIVALEQIGRALSVRENIKEKRLEYNSLEIDKLKELARSRGIIFDEDIIKENLIELLLSPTIIDLTGNIEFLEELETNLKDRVRERIKKGNIPRERADFLEKYSPFMLEEEKKKILIGLLNLKNQVQRETWDDYYRLALVYYNHYGDSDIKGMFKTKNGIDYDENGVQLGAWCNTQRRNFADKKMPEDRILKLELIKFRFENNYDELKWQKMYTLALAYYNHYGNSDMVAKFKTKDGYTFDESGVNLGSWCWKQRDKFKCGKLNEEKIQKLEQINFRFENDKLEIQWQKMYSLAEIYFKHYGNLKLPEDFKTKDGINFDETGDNLFSWIGRQKEAFRKGKLSEERIKKLEQINFIFEDKYDLAWKEKYNLAVIYFKHHGHSEIPQSFKTKNGYDYDEYGLSLGRWCNKQRGRKKKLTEEQIQKLKQINFRFETNYKELEWEKMYDLAAVYFNVHGNSEIPGSFKTKDGINIDDTGVCLGTWCYSQRQFFKKRELTETKIQKLKQINFRFEGNHDELQWEMKYGLAKTFFEYYGHSDIKKSFKTKDGITKSKDKDAINLGDWCGTQKAEFKEGKLSEERRKKLEQINFIFEDKDEWFWQKMYDLAMVYYNHYGNTEIPAKFKTINGFIQDETGEKLGGWCDRQRTTFNNYKPGEDPIMDERKRKLDLIEFRFKTRKETETEKIELCNAYGMDFNKYKILDKMPYQELYAKIMYLLDNNFPLVIDGKLHHIFTMCNENMMISYGVSKEDLIMNYYINGKGRK